MQINCLYHGFRLTEISEVPELNARGYRFLHEKSGADLLWLSCDDKNCAFSISFKTLPENSTGVFHILEHSVLCGSRKYPLREPFVELLKGSMQTFLNAMTFPDKTMYPVASINERDFVNLMDVYLDAVFHPRIYSTEAIFLQEGWHYLPDGDGGTFSGVVYNEMKGSYSSPDTVLYHSIQEQMFPDNCYGFSSGGNPPSIKELTYEEFLATHERFYHPDNSYIYLYGDLDIEEKLAHLDENYLSHYERRGMTFEIEGQPMLGDRLVTQAYEISPEESLENNTMLARNVSLCAFDDRETQIATDVLLSALTSTNTAPLKKAMLDAKLGDDFAAWVNDGIQEPYVTFRLKKADPGKTDLFLKVLYGTLERLAEEGVDKSLLEATLNRKEFAMREMDFGSAPGVVLAMAVMDTWLYGGDPLDAVRYQDIFARIREGLERGGYFEALIREKLLSCDHALTLVLEPSHTVATERAEREALDARRYGEALGDTGLSQNADKLEKLAQYQTEEDTPEARKTLPHLSLSDLAQEEKSVPCDTYPCGSVLHRYYPLSTNGIGYVNLYFDCGHLTVEELQYAALLSEVLFEMPTKQRDTLAYKTLMSLKMGKLYASLIGATAWSDKTTYTPYFSVHGSFLEENREAADAIILEGLREVIVSGDEIEAILRQELIGVQNSMIRSGHSFATLRASCGLNYDGYIGDMTRGIGYLKFLERLASETDAASLAERLQGVLARILKGTLTVSYTGSRDLRKAYAASPYDFGGGGQARAEWPQLVGQVREAHPIAGSVAYNASVVNLAAEIPYSGKMRVLAKILGLDYLWNRVRVRGGAYGAFARLEWMGLSKFASYRDPQVGATYEAYHAMPAYLESFCPDEDEMTKYIIGATSAADTPLRSYEEAEAQDMLYFQGRGQEDMQALRTEMLTATAEDMRAYAAPLRDALIKASICTVASEKLITENHSLFE